MRESVLCHFACHGTRVKGKYGEREKKSVKICNVMPCILSLQTHTHTHTRATTFSSKRNVLQNKTNSSMLKISVDNASPELPYSIIQMISWQKWDLLR